MSNVVWHDIECGAYSADLALWRELADEAASEGAAHVLDVGCGTGRVSLDLAKRGHRVTALDLDRELLDELERRAADEGLEIETAAGDARDLDIGRSFDLVIAPMQLVQLLRGVAERGRFLTGAARHLRPGGLLAAALMDLAGEPVGADYLAPLPDMGEVDGCMYSSLPIAVRPIDRGRAVVLERVRKIVSPAGEVTEERDSIRLRLVGPEQLQQEGAQAGLTPGPLRRIAPTEDHVGSVVVVFEGSGG